MNWREWALAHMNEHGMSESDAVTVVELLEKGGMPKAVDLVQWLNMRRAWSVDIERYPQETQSIVRVLIYAAVQHINENHPTVLYQCPFNGGQDDALLLTQAFLTEQGYEQPYKHHWLKDPVLIHDTTSGTEPFSTSLLAKVAGHLFPRELKTRRHLRLLTELLEATSS